MTNGQILRVIAGKYKGRALRSPSSSKTHPMGSREKLALFNMLQPWLLGAKVLDIYAGSGALGIEALSRGASEAVFVERDRLAEQAILVNLRSIGPGDRGQVYRDSAASFAQRPEFTEYFDMILADPPYDNFQGEEVQALTRLLKMGGILALSYPKAEQLEFTGLEVISQHSYAAAGIALYRKA